MKIRFSTIILGLLVIAAGVLLYLFNAGTLDPAYKKLVFSWQALLIALGFTCLFSRHKFGFGLLLMLAGGFFLASNSLCGGFIAENKWTLLLIAGGVWIIGHGIFARRGMQKRMRDIEQFRSGMGPHGEGNDPRPDMGEISVEFHGLSCRHDHARHRGVHSRREQAGYIDRSYVFGGSKEKIDLTDFRGGEINCVFGGMELDLRGASLAEGTNILEIKSIFGGIVIYVPREWRVEVRQSAVFGKFTDNRPGSDPAQDNSRVLIIHATSVFGGGELKCSE